MERIVVAAAFSVAAVNLSAGQAAQLPPACKASYVVVSSIADKAIAVPDEFKADLDLGTVKLEVGSFLTGKPLAGGEAKDLSIDWKARAGRWDAGSASTVIELLRKAPNGILLWSGTTQPTCHQDVGNPVPEKVSK